MINPIHSVITDKPSRQLAARVGSITQRFGLAERPVQDDLQALASLLKKYNAPATWSISAEMVERHAKTLHPLELAGVEFDTEGTGVTAEALTVHSADNLDELTERWLAALADSHEQSERLSLSLNLSQIEKAQRALQTVLEAARRETPQVWIASESQVESWELGRVNAHVELVQRDDGRFQLEHELPQGATILVRGLNTFEPTAPWSASYRRIIGQSCNVRTEQKPVIGVAETFSAESVAYLRRQGFLVEVGVEPDSVSCYLDALPEGVATNAELVAWLEANPCSLIRIGRWPFAAQSALSLHATVDDQSRWDSLLSVFAR